MERDKDGLTPQEAATRSQCTPDFIAGVKYAMRLAKRDYAEYITEAEGLVNGGDMVNMMNDIDTLDAQASTIHGVISKLDIRIFVMEGEGWIPDPDLLIER